MSSIALQIGCTSAESVAVSNNVVFETATDSAGNIDYIDSAVINTFSKGRQYAIN